VPNGYLRKTQNVVLVFQKRKCGLKYVMYTSRRQVQRINEKCELKYVMYTSRRQVQRINEAVLRQIHLSSEKQIGTAERS
jgi:hypothetical protein